MDFEPWVKTPRLYRQIVVTEKIDGQQAAIAISDDEFLLASRNGWLQGNNDLHGFKDWALANEESLRAELGNGFHRGEWYGYKVNRGYGLDTNRLALFNTKLYNGKFFNTPGLGSVPILYQGNFSEWSIQGALRELREHGSSVVKGYNRPEGVCIYHTQSGHTYKVLLENDDKHKSEL